MVPILKSGSSQQQVMSMEAVVVAARVDKEDSEREDRLCLI